jgi:hypothetical protein
VKDLRWKLDDANGGFPPHEPEFGYGPSRSTVPAWATHIVAFLVGGIAFGLSLVAWVFLPMIAVAGFAGYATLSWRKRR